MPRSASAALIDTSFLVALLDPRDALHEPAMALTKALASKKTRMVTTDAVLVELANYFSRSPLRAECIAWIAALRADPGWEIVVSDRALLSRAEARYRRYSDTTWALTDCVSMEVMTAANITDAATNDAHFEQAGFRILLSE